MERTSAEHFQALFWQLVPQCRVDGDRRGADWIEEQLRELGDDRGDRLGRYVFATGLLAHGRLDAAEVILNNVLCPNDDPGGQLLSLGHNALRALLPLPDELRGEPGSYSRVPVEGVRQWLRQHRDELRWDEGRGRFVLDG